MSQKVRILGARVKGTVFVGCVRPDGVEGPAAPAWSSDPEVVVGWLCAGFRARFNQHRAWRGRYAYASGERVLDVEGEPILVPLGSNPTALKDSEARVRHPHLAALPDRVLMAPAKVENDDWFAATKRRKTLRGKGRKPGGMPSFRRKHDDLRFVCWSDRNATLTKTGRRSGIVTIRGTNPTQWRGGRPMRWSIQIRVRLSQDIRPYTSVRVNWTRRELVFTNPPAAVAKKQVTGAAVGLDLGVNRTIVTSDSVFHDQPKTTDLDKRIRHHQKRMAKSRRVNNPTGVKNWTPTKRYVQHRGSLAEAHRAKAARLDDWRQKTTTSLIRHYDLIAIEDLNVKNMTKSAAGTLEQPGKNVAQKSGLNRSLAQSAFATIRAMLLYKTEALIRAGYQQELLAVNPRNTSRRCNPCGHTAKGNRKSQAVFRCIKCAHTGNADINAARNVLDDALNLWGRTVPAGSKDKTNPSEEVPASVLAGTCDEPQTTHAA